MNSKKIAEKYKNYLAKNIDKVIIKKTTRGYIAFLNETKKEKYKIDYFHYWKNEKYPRAIEIEFQNLVSGNLKNLLKSPWWENDIYLAKEYINLFNQLAGFTPADAPDFSRNMVAANKACCYSWIQRIADKLIVVCRSTDMAKGYLWDVEMAKYLAARYKCRQLEMVFLHQHIYLKNLLKTDWIARRGIDDGITEKEIWKIKNKIIKKI